MQLADTKPPRARRPGWPRAVFLWCLAFFAAFQLGLLLAKELWQPALADPEYGRKLARLRACLAERPGARPLVLALGSSRTSMGLRAECLRVNQSARAEGPLVFNFGLCQFGPTGELMCLRRLLADGVRPDTVLVEVYPAVMQSETDTVDQFDIHRLRWSDREVFARRVSQPDRLRRRWLRAQLVPWYYQRFLLLNHFLPEWLARDNRMDSQWQGMTAAGWVLMPNFENPNPGWEVLELPKHRSVLAEFRPAEGADLALRELFALCREYDIAATAVLLPESGPYRACYGAACLAGLDDYLDDLRDQYGVRIIDAREWVPDAGFVEGVHMTHWGALVFTVTLEERILPALVTTPAGARVRP